MPNIKNVVRNGAGIYRKQKRLKHSDSLEYPHSIFETHFIIIIIDDQHIV
jgi:ribosome-associated protein YbcJ (S4-like RNA binding protein)